MSSEYNPNAKAKYCEYCAKHPDIALPDSNGYSSIWREDAYICPCCNHEMTDIILTCDELAVIYANSKDVIFLQEMIKLKENDIVDFQLKLAQLRPTKYLKDEIWEKEVEKTSVPQCPHCGSANIQSISGLERGASVFFWGLFSKKINKSFKCNNCGYTW